MSLAAITAKVRGVKLHLFKLDAGKYYCGITGNLLATWNPDECISCGEGVSTV